MKTMMLLTGSLMLAGCMAEPEPADNSGQASPASPEASSEAAHSSGETQMQIPQDLEEGLQAARNDLSEKTGHRLEEITVSRLEHVTWRSGALGCPDPEMMYTQALVPGYRIELVADNQRYHYHGASGREPSWCPTERVERPAEVNQDGLPEEI